MKEGTVVIDYSVVPFKYKAQKFVRQLPRLIKKYILSMLPILQWIHKYNLTWLTQDLIAGITVGIVVVPQSMAYAKVANLDPQYGLYTSFVGVTLYCIFGTSKDISIGPISTVSLLMSSVINSVVKADPTITPAEVAVSLGLFAGIIMVMISLLRLGILVDFIPEPAIAGYMTGSAITIILSQWPKLFGIRNISTHDSPYMVFVNILTKLSHTRLDVAFGLASLVSLYLIRYACARLNFKSPRLQKSIFLFGIMRNGLIVILGTFASFMVCRGHTTSPIAVIESVPAGFDAMGVPRLNFHVLREAGGTLPSIVLILFLEHISVAKSFGRIYDYQINPDQEILAIGLCNVVGSFFGGFPSTGAFSRTAIMARSGSRTPFAGVFSGAIIVLALYALTPAFYYIPDAVLAAVVIHAVSDLASSKKYLKELWKISFSEFMVWISAVFVTIFVDVETGIYSAVGMSLALMLYKFSRPTVKTLAKINAPSDQTPNDTKYIDDMISIEVDKVTHIYVDENDPNFQPYINNNPTSILMFRPCDSILYPNVEHISDIIVETVKTRTRCGNLTEMNKSDNERSWSHRVSTNDPLKGLEVLEALILDFSAVSRIDATALQTLRVTRETIDKYAGRPVEWHFTNLQNPSVRSALIYAGFGSLDRSDDGASLDFNVNIENSIIVNNLKADDMPNEKFIGNTIPQNLGHQHTRIGTPVDKFPCFHWDINSAMDSIHHRWTKSRFEFDIRKLDTEMTIA